MISTPCTRTPIPPQYNYNCPGRHSCIPPRCGCRCEVPLRCQFQNLESAQTFSGMDLQPDMINIINFTLSVEHKTQRHKLVTKLFLWSGILLNGNTVDSRYIAVQYYTILHTVQQFRRQNIGQTSTSRKTAIPRLHGLSSMNYWEKSDREISGVHGDVIQIKYI